MRRPTDSRRAFLHQGLGLVGASALSAESARGYLANDEIRVACLGSGADWTDVPENAAVWARRALAHSDFDGAHLDVEPWTASDWPARAEQRAHLARHEPEVDRHEHRAHLCRG